MMKASGFFNSSSEISSRSHIPVIHNIKMSVFSSLAEPGVIRYALYLEDKNLKNVDAKKLINVFSGIAMLVGAMVGTLKDGNTADEAVAWTYLKNALAF